jgi:hypothetical protein
MSQAHEHDFKTHITILGWLHIISNVLFLVIGLLGFLFMAGIGFASGDPTAVRVLGLIGIIAAVFFAVLALPGLVAGIGLLTRQTWSRVLALVIGFLSLINIPVGTAIGVYTFRLLPGVW